MLRYNSLNPHFRPSDSGTPQEPTSVIEQLVEALRYKPEGRRFEFSMGTLT